MNRKTFLAALVLPFFVKRVSVPVSPYATDRGAFRVYDDGTYAWRDSTFTWLQFGGLPSTFPSLQRNP